MVCGQIHPQKILPKAMVKMIIQIKETIAPIVKIKKSCG